LTFCQNIIAIRFLAGAGVGLVVTILVRRGGSVRTLNVHSYLLWSIHQKNWK